MLKKTITYTDYDGVERTEDFYFNLSKAELVELEMSFIGGLSGTLTRMVETRDNVKLIDIFKKILRMSYGEKSLDGKRFIKSDEISNNFFQTEAYSELMMELIADQKNIEKFINAIIPKTPTQQASGPPTPA